VLRQVVFLEVLATMVALFWLTGKGGKWQVSWCLRRPQIIHDVGSVCISTKWLFNFFLVKINLKQELQVKETCGKRESNQLAILHHKAVLRYILPPLPPISYSSSSSSFFSSSPFSCSSSLRRFGKPPGPPSSPTGTCRTGTGLLLPQVPKY
jgi:hypothetical protein